MNSGGQDPIDPDRSEFLGRLGHDLRTPLNAILGFAMLLQRSEPLSARQRESLVTIEQSGQQLLGRINRLLEQAEFAPGDFQLGAAHSASSPVSQPAVLTNANAQGPSRRVAVSALPPHADAPKVLVVDDTPANVQLLTELLQAEGLQVLAADNGSLGISLAQRFAPDVILLDVQMRGLGGLQTCGALKADPRTQEIPVIFMTVVSDTASKLEAFDAGAADYITKPFHLDEALARIQTQLRLTQAQKLLARQNARLQQEVLVRQHAEDEVRRLNDALEGRVRERTAQLEVANRELQAFCYSVAHDLRGPLAAIDGFSVLLEEAQRQDSADARRRHYLSRIRTGIRHMDALTDALLSLAHLSLLEQRHEPVDLSTLASDSLQGLQSAEPQRRVDAIVQPGLQAQGDPTLLKLLVKHLVENAWKFSVGQERARIEVGCEIAAAQPPAYFVRDNGIGFDMAYADKLFKPFQRLHAAGEFSGVGAGLALVERIVAKHGGRVWAQGAPGQGATFYFTLSRESADSA